MGQTIARNDEMAERARKLYVPYVVGYKQVAKLLGCSATTVRRYVSPDFRERSRIASLEGKRRRTGTCERCGGETRYNGRTNNGPSRICATCLHTWTHCEKGHEYTPETDLRGQPGYQRSGGNSCRICRNEYAREYNRRRYASDPAFREAKRIENAKRYTKHKAKVEEAAP